MPHQKYQSSIDAAIHCAYECEHCADECYSEVKMAECGRLARDTAEICWAIAGFMSRGSRFIPSLIDSCIEICDACIKECQKHDNQHCQSCAEACQKAIEQYKKITDVAAARV